MLDLLFENLDIKLTFVEDLIYSNKQSVIMIRAQVRRIGTILRNPYRLDYTKEIENEDYRFFSRMVKGSGNRTPQMVAQEAMRKNTEKSKKGA